MSSLIRELFCNQCQVAVNSPGITIELAVYLTDHELPHYTIHVQVGVHVTGSSHACNISLLRDISNTTIRCIGKPSSISIL